MGEESNKLKNNIIDNVQEYLAGYYKGNKNPNLNAMKFFMDEFGHPEKNLNVIHIAGTNGKGSCVETMTKILVEAGYKVGKFLSPHLIKYNERISINNEDISDNEMKKLINEIHPKIEEYNKKHDTKITLFELETTMAILYFKRQKCDFVVLETGLGGLHDCTNIVNPIVSIITSIGYDHTHILGNTLEKITTQKAGIIKENSSTVFIKQNEDEVNEVIENTCNKKHNSLHLIKPNEITNYSFDDNYQKFDYRNYKEILINLKGKKQIYNASLCIECIEILKNKGYKISEDSLRKALKTVIHRGRFEKMCDEPIIIFDGAHNELAIENFLNSVKMYYKNEKKIYIISILKTKDYETIIKKMKDEMNSIFIFTDGNDKNRYRAKEELFEVSEKYINAPKYKMSLEEAIKTVKKQYKDYVIFLVGSFYIYGNIKNYDT